MPIVRESIEEETGIVPSSEVHPDEAVAIGAAYYVLDALKTEKKKVEKGESDNKQVLNAAIPETSKSILLQMLRHMGLELFVREITIWSLILLYCRRIHKCQQSLQMSTARRFHFKKNCIFR